MNVKKDTVKFDYQIKCCKNIKEGGYRFVLVWGKNLVRGMGYGIKARCGGIFFMYNAKKQN